MEGRDPSVHPLRLLIVEDDLALREGLAQALRGEGYDVRMASSGVEGLNYLRAALPFHAVVVDVRMPHMNGLEFLEAMKQNRVFQKVPAIGMSAMETKAEWRATFDEWLDKPIDLDRLLGVLPQVIEKGRRQQGNTPTQKLPDDPFRFR